MFVIVYSYNFRLYSSTHQPPSPQLSLDESGDIAPALDEVFTDVVTKQEHMLSDIPSCRSSSYVSWSVSSSLWHCRSLSKSALILSVCITAAASSKSSEALVSPSDKRSEGEQRLLERRRFWRYNSKEVDGEQLSQTAAQPCLLVRR